MTRVDFEHELDLLLLDMVPSGADGPESSMLRKASIVGTRILALVDRYVEDARVSPAGRQAIR